ncbi:hypothetical protein ACFYP4_01740 [Streptomyces sp. NPDC005551]|uniref:hypothetical protein n=1 Tax=Streptomyces sp. NPDC005551 TaxID=3364725 RepID=UPI00367523E9
MLRGSKARALLSALAAVLLVLQLFASSEAFASVHTSEIISCAETEDPQKVAPPAAARDRSRGQDRVPEAPVGGSPAPAHPRVLPLLALAGPDPHASKSPAAHSPAALQVFRC